MCVGHNGKLSVLIFSYVMGGESVAGLPSREKFFYVLQINHSIVYRGDHDKNAKT